MAKLVPAVISQLICKHEWKHAGQQFVKVSKRKFELRDKEQCTKCLKSKLKLIQ